MKPFTVVDKIGIHELRRALRRSYRNGVFVPPSPVLRLVLEQMPEIIEHDDSFSLRAGVKYLTLGHRSSEKRIVELIRKAGGLIDRRELQRQANAAGVTNPSFWQVVRYSPLVQRFARGVYGLISVSPGPGIVEELRSSASRKSGGVIDRGWTNDGCPWIAYRLSSGAFETGIVGIPTGFRELLDSEYHIRMYGADTSTLLRLKGYSMWGFRRLVEDAGAESGDCLVMVFRLHKQEVELEIGDESILDRFLASNEA